MAKDPNEYLNLVTNYANNPDFKEERIKLTNEIFNQTIANHTYLNRMKDLCNGLGLVDLVEKFDKAINNLIKD
jgi:hypothetical protein